MFFSISSSLRPKFLGPNDIFLDGDVEELVFGVLKDDADAFSDGVDFS